MDMAYIPAGTFQMGSPLDEPGRVDNSYVKETLHTVTLTKGFYMSIYETTNAQYVAFLEAMNVGENGQAMVDGSDIRLASQRNMEWNGDSWVVIPGFENHPVVYISWNAAMAFADWAGGSLPTEAQWEYACRAGNQTAWYFGSNESDLGDYAWYAGNSGNERHAVGGKLPNAWGLYDMHGNVEERCIDWFDIDLGSSPVVDPDYSLSSVSRVKRGGSYLSPAADTRSASRINALINIPNDGLGFRIVVNLP
jgi:formylglycine-generating enzyme required for sulfatase activity